MAKAGAIKAVIAAQFDDTGLKKAQKEFGKLGSTIKGALGAAGIGIGLSSIVSGLQDATRAAIDDTKSQALLANQLRNTVGASESQIASVEASIASMQKQAAVADDEIRPAFANLVRATGDVTRATELTNLALDVAAGTGKDLGTVSLALGKAVNGSTTSLIKLVPSIKGASDPMAVLAQQFAGASDAAAKNDPIKRLNILFGEMQEQIGTALLPSLERFSDWMAGPSGTQLINGLVASFENIVSQATLAGDGIAYLGKQASDAFGDAEISDNAAAVAGNILAIGGNAAKAANPLGALIKYLQLLGIISNATKPSSAGTDETDRLIRRRLESLGAVKPTDLTPDKPTTKKAVTDYVAEFGTNMADELRKQMAKVRLGNKGLSEGLIESIIGSGAGWYKVYQSILNSSDTALGRLQKNWNATASGIKELEGISQAAADVAKATADAAAAAAEAAAEIAKAASEAAIAAAEDALSQAQDVFRELQSLADDAQVEVDKYAKYFNPLPKTVIEVYDAAVENLSRLQEESARTLDNMAAGMADIRAEVNKSAQSFKDLAKTAEPIGAWESKVNDSFSNITASAQKAFDNKLITEDAYKNLMAYAGREQKLLTDIAKKRDALAEKISLAKALYSDTRAAVVSFGNITGLLKQQSETVTETTSKIVDGVATTIQRSVEKITSTNLVDEYKKIIDKTRAFATNLNALKSMGLNKDLFKQIIDAGVDVGGETASAIAAGGPAVVGELNGLFAELQTVGEQVAETTTVVMYNNGVDVVGGFINGLLSEDAGLAAAATTIAVIFADTFKIMLDGAMKSVFDAMKAQLDAAIAAAKAAVDKALADMKTAYDKAVADAKTATDAANKAKADADAAAAALKKLVTPEPTVAPVVIPEPIVAPIAFDPGDFVAVGRGAGATGFRGGSSTVDGKATINLTVNAGLGTNGAQLGGQIVELIKKYEKSSGAVFA